MRVPLLGGAYQSRSVIANAQRCINYFPERNPKDSPVPTTHYQRPGFVPLTVPTSPGRGRGIFRASNGAGYCVIGDNAYFIDSNFQLNLLGSVAVGPNVNPVSFVDNGVEGLLVDGTAMGGWSINLASQAFAQIVDPTGAFQGADRLDYLDGYILYNIQGTDNFGSTHVNSLTFDPLFFGTKAVWPDPLQSLVVCRREILLLGQVRSEIWYDAGLSLFPFAILPGTYIEHGVFAKYSVARQDISTYWLGQDSEGFGIVMRHRGYATERISNHALEVQIRNMLVKSDAVGYCYQQDGHTFYVLSFPSADQTWAFDESSGEWHQRCWTDQDGILHRDRSNAHANLYGTNVVLDWQNGTLYKLDLNTYTDTVNGVVSPITCIRSFPHITMGEAGAAGGQLVDSDGRRMQFRNVRVDLECGLGPLTIAGLPAQVGLRYSCDKGHTFEETILQSAGNPGEYITQPQWLQEGISRDMVFEISHSIAGNAALNSLWVNATVLQS